MINEALEAMGIKKMPKKTTKKTAENTVETPQITAAETPETTEKATFKIEKFEQPPDVKMQIPIEATLILQRLENEILSLGNEEKRIAALKAEKARTFQYILHALVKINGIPCHSQKMPRLDKDTNMVLVPQPPVSLGYKEVEKLG